MTIRLKTVAATAALGLLAWGAAAQGPSHHPDKEIHAVKALSAEQTRDLLEGRGSGAAKAAELNRHPGPMHVLELASQLGLSVGDVAAVRRVFETMRTEARELGGEIVTAESDLDRLFAHGHADAAAALTAKIGVLQGRLRAAHLKAHLAIRPMLAAETIARYDSLRGYAGEAARGQGLGANTHRH